MIPCEAPIIGQFALWENGLNPSQSNLIVVLRKWCSPGNFQIELNACILDFPKILGINQDTHHWGSWDENTQEFCEHRFGMSLG